MIYVMYNLPGPGAGFYLLLAASPDKASLVRPRIVVPSGAKP